MDHFTSLKSKLCNFSRSLRHKLAPPLNRVLDSRGPGNLIVLGAIILTLMYVDHKVGHQPFVALRKDQAQTRQATSTTLETLNLSN